MLLFLLFLSLQSHPLTDDVLIARPTVATESGPLQIST